MMRSRILSLMIIILTILSSFSTFPSQCEEEEVHFRVLKVYWGEGQPVEVSPGETAQLTVILRYEMSKSLNNLKASLSLPEGFQAIGGGNESVAVYTKTIVKGSILELRFPLFIGSNVTLRRYTANLTLEYFISEYTILNSTVTVEFEVTGKPALAIRALNDSLRQGEQKVLLLLLNEGDASMHSLKITRIHSSTISIEPMSRKSIDYLKPGGNLTLPVRLFVPASLSGKIASLTIEGSYLGPTNAVYSFSKTIQLPVKLSNPAPLRLTITPGELTIGRRSGISIRLENIGGHNLSEIKMSLSPEGALEIFGPANFYIDRLPPGEARLIETEVYVPSVTSQTASLKVAVTYLDDDLWVSRSETYHLSVLLKEGEIHFRVLRVYWGDDQPIEVSPGETAQLTVILRYEMSKSLNNLKAALSLPRGFEAIGGDNESIIVYTKTILKGSILELRFPLFIGSNVMPGSYTANLTLEYFISEYTILNSTVTVEFEVTGKPALDLKALNDSLRQGEQKILLLLSNEGEASMHDLRITRIHSSTASVELARYELIGELKPGENLTLPVRLFVPPSLSGKIASLTIEGSYLGPTNVSYSFSKTIQLPVKPSNPVPLRLTITPGELIIGRRSGISIRLENIGGHNLSEIKISLSPEGALKIFGLTSFYIEKLTPGESRLIETEVYVPSVTSQTASLKVAVTYLDDDLWISRSETHHLSVLLRGFIDISLTDIAVIPSAPTPGSPFSITITITNIGTSTAYAAYAIPDLKGLPLRSFGPRSVYVGNIETNLPTTITINLQLENTTQRRIVLPVIIRYLDNLRTPHNVTFNIPIIVAPLKKSEIHAPKPRKTGMSIQDPLLLGIIAIIIAVVAVIAIALKRWR